MNTDFNTEERELIKLVGFFKKRAEKQIEEKKAGEEYLQLIETCEKLVGQLQEHARYRFDVLSAREQLKKMVSDNARCPRCTRNTHLKLSGVEKSPEGWKSNKYRCRRCNIQFVWNAPNNPWDMVPYVEKFVADLDKRIEEEQIPEETKEMTIAALAQMKDNLATLKPVVEASDRNLAEFERRDQEMSDIVHRFKKQLMIEKIRMED